MKIFIIYFHFNLNCTYNYCVIFTFLTKSSALLWQQNTNIFPLIMYYDCIQISPVSSLLLKAEFFQSLWALFVVILLKYVNPN